MSGFTQEQTEAIEWYEGPLLVIGTPGSGKTTVIINRINNLIYGQRVAPSNILVITFTRAAAESMRRRFLDLTDLKTTKVRFGTFHSFFFWILRTAYGDRLRVLDEKGKRNIIKSILLKLNRELYDNEETMASVMNQLLRLSTDMIPIENYYSTDMAEGDFRKLYEEYVEYKKTNGFIDFDDMIVECYKLLSERPDILAKVREMYPFIMVDEFQDTNRLQYEILKLLAHPLDNIYVVGDDDQSIYGFRGARPDVMLSFIKDFEGAETIRLSENFRCPEAVVGLSARLISSNINRFDKSLRSATGRGGKIRITSVSDINAECDLVAKRIGESLRAGVKPSDIAVLYRTNIGPRRLIYRLRDRGIGFDIKDALPDIFAGPIVQPVLNYITFALGENTRQLFLTFMNKPVRYISRAMLTSERVTLEGLMEAAGDKDYLKDKIRRLWNELRTISSLSPYAAFNYIRKAMGYDLYLAERAEELGTDLDEMMDSLEEAASIIRDTKNFSEMYEAIGDYRKMVKAQAEESGMQLFDPDHVQLMTLHSAKGLEFEEVHILDVYDGNIPHRKQNDKFGLEEERRLLYVGMTRSSDRLYMYAPRIVREKATRESIFIQDLDLDQED